MPDIENLLNIEDEVTQVLSDLGVNEKLNEMDDFMNQNDLKVQITNENAVVTGLVTYTCTVKDKNNTALANKVVEWYKGTTLIGIDATDSNGVSTFSHRVTEADIYDVHAIVRGTHAGDDIRMFVKDNRNILSYNVWSCGDYNNDTTGFQISAGANAAVLSLTSDKVVNGFKCLKHIKTTDNTSYVMVKVVIPITEELVGKTLTATGKIQVNGTTSAMMQFFGDNNLGSVSIPVSDDFVSVSNSSEIPDTSNIEIRIGLNNSSITDDCYYLDDFCVIIQ